MVKKLSIFTIIGALLILSYNKNVFSSNIKVDPEIINLGYVFIQDDPKIDFTIINFSSSATFTVENQNISCELNYVPQLSSIRCSSKIVVQSKALNSEFTYNLAINLRSGSDSYTLSITISGVWASPIPSLPSNIDFGGTLVGKSKTIFVQIENFGKFPLIVTQTYFVSPFFITITNFRVDAESKFFVPVIFTPSSEGNFSGSITFFSNIGELKISAVGYGVKNPFPSLYLQNTVIDFGTIFPNESSRFSFVISNVGAENLIIKRISSESQAFYIESITFPFVVEPMKKLEFQLFFIPEKEGSFQSYINIESNDPDKTYVKVSVSGKASKPNISVPESINFERIRVYYQSKKDLSIVNSGLFPVMISQISLSGDQVFNLTLNFELPRIILYESPVTIPLVFSPQDVTEYSAVLRLYFVVPNSSNFSFDEYRNVESKIFEVKLYGAGGYPRIKLSKAEQTIDFGDVWSDDSSSRSFSVENTGTVTLNANFYVDSENFILSDEIVSIPPGGAYPIKVSFVPNGKSGEIRGVLKILSDDPSNREITLILYGRSKVPEIVYRGGGCISVELQHLYALAGAFILILLLVVLRKLTKLLIIIIVITFLHDYGYTFSIVSLPNSYDKFFFVRSIQTSPEGNFKFGFISSYLYSPLFETAYKFDSEVYRRKIFDYVIVSNPAFIYSLNNSTEFYLLPAMAYTRGEYSGLHLMDTFLGMKGLIGNAGRYEIGSELFLGLPTGNKRYLESTPFSGGAILIISKGQTSINSGVIYGGKDIPFRLLISLGHTLSISRMFFLSLENFSFLPIAVKRGFVASEASLLAGVDLEDIFLKVGGSKGIIGGLGSADFRIMFSAGLNFNPRSNHNIKYFKLRGKIVDEFGNQVSSCNIIIEKLFLSYKAKDGIFELKLPYGFYEASFICDGFMNQKIWVSPADPDLQVRVRRSSSLLVLYSSDGSGVPIEQDMSISFDGKTFNISAYYVTLEGSKEYEIRVSELSRTVNVSDGFALWLGIGRSTQGWTKIEEKKDTMSNESAKSEKISGPTEKTFAVESEGERQDIEEGKEYKPSKLSEDENEKDLSKKMIQRREKLSSSFSSGDLAKVDEELRKSFPVRPFSIYSAEGNIVFKKVIDSFQLGSASIPPQKYVDLEDAVKFIKNNIENISEIIIEGHTDDIGKFLWNIELSYQRAESVRKFLINKGVIFPFKIVGYGDSFPIEETSDDSLKFRNRRVEIKVFFKK